MTCCHYYAITEGDFPKRLGIPLEVEQIEAEKEDPGIKKRFEQELRKPESTSQPSAQPNNEEEHAHMHEHGVDHHHHHG